MQVPTLKDLAPPGFLNFSPSATDKTQKVIAWVNAIFALRIEQTELFDSIFRLWATRDYSSATLPRTPYLAYLANQVGLAWFQGANQQMASLIAIARRGWSHNDTENFLFLLTAFSLSPFFWVDFAFFPQITFGTQQPAIFAENFILYSSSVGAPSTPPPQTYIEREWLAPVGWSKQPSTSNWFVRGYLVGLNIVWSTTVYATSLNFKTSQVDIPSNLPASPSNGDIAFVKNDSTGDVNAVYFWDAPNTTWRKNTAINSTQGLVTGSFTDPLPRAVRAPNSDSSPFPITSENPPPATGPTQGFGMYAGYSNQALSSSQIALTVRLTEQGYLNLSVLLYFLRRIKPAKNSLSLNYSVPALSLGAQTIFIADTGDL